MHQGWLTYLYQFIIGGLFFAVGIVYVVRVKGADLKLSEDRKWTIALVVGFFGLAVVMAVWTILAINS